MAKISEILKQAKALIADEKSWTQGEAARNSQGEYTYSLNPDAVCWCSAGAVNKVTKDNWLVIETIAKHLHTTLEQDFNYYEGIPNYNDEHTHAEVMAFWDKAIAAAEAREETE